MSDDDPLLAVEDLRTHYPITTGLLGREVGRVRAVDGISFEVDTGEIFGLVGESGSGKTTTAHSILGLESPTDGTIRFDGQPLAEHSDEQSQSFRRRVQLIVQDPNEAFNPRMTAGEAVAEPLVIHGMADPQRRRAIVTDLLEHVGLDAADADRYPHEFSGGEKQRLALARALVVDPDLLIADEPTSALDGRIQTEILGLLEDIRTTFDISILFISHDIDLVRRFCDRVAVMYLGKIVERGAVEEVLETPAHPYTRLLLDSVPTLDPDQRPPDRPLTDTIPDPADPPDGCRFHTRCPAVIPPEDVEIAPDRWRRVAAFRFELQAGELPPAVEPGETDPAAVRSAVDLPATLSDRSIEAAVADAVDAISAGEVRTASERLAEAIPTVCERDRPRTITENERDVRCHRYDDRTGGEPPEWAE